MYNVVIVAGEVREADATFIGALPLIVFSQLDFMFLLYSFQMIFSVNHLFTRAPECKQVVYILLSEYTIDEGEHLCTLNSLFSSCYYD